MLIQMSMSMSTQLLLLLTTSSPIPIRIPNSTHRRSSTPAFSAAPPRWDSNAEPIPKGRRYAFDLDGDDDHDDDDRSFVYNVGPNKNKKKRVWWSELDGSEADDDNDDEEEFDQSTDEEFWGFKVLAAFGWMVPAVGISLLLGTGPNAFLMALAVPLGQRLISLAFDKAVGIAGDASKPRYRPTKIRRKPYPKAKAKADTQKATEQRRESRSDGERKGYKSWAAADPSYTSVGDEGQSRYGGWDDLDHKSRAGKAGADSSAPWRDGDSDGPFRQQRKSKSRNRVGRGKETPLLMRLLIAAFPFLGFWTRLF